MAVTFDTPLAQQVLSRLLNSNFAVGDMVRGYAALNCLRAGLLLDKGVLSYIESKADANIISFDIDEAAPQLSMSLKARQDKSSEYLSKKIQRNAPFARSSVYYHALKAFQLSPMYRDKSLYREHMQQLLRRMRADRVAPDLQTLSKLLIETLGSGVSVEATLFCHICLMRALVNFLGRSVFVRLSRMVRAVILCWCFLQGIRFVFSGGSF